MSHPSPDPRTARLAQAYEALTPHTLPALLALYDKEAGFKDPFNQVRGAEALARIYIHMFETLEVPRFKILHTATEGDLAYLVWDFTFQRKGKDTPWRIHGATQIRYTPTGLVQDHRDYWDAAEELYEKLPLVGALMRWLRGRLRVN